MRKRLRDFILWMLFVIMTGVHYYTKTQGTSEQGYVEFFIILWTVSFVGLTAIKVWTPEQGREIIDYDENLTRSHLDWIVLGVVAVEVIAVIFTAFAASFNKLLPVSIMAMYVPRLQLAVYDDVLFNLGLVATAEESSKMLGIKALSMKLGHTKYGRAFSIVIPVGFWALLHGYQAYVVYGETVMWIMIAAAFVCGLVLFELVKRTRSIMTAFIVHACHNILIVLSQAFL